MKAQDEASVLDVLCGVLCPLWVLITDHEAWKVLTDEWLHKTGMLLWAGSARGWVVAPPQHCGSACLYARPQMTADTTAALLHWQSRELCSSSAPN